VPPQYKFMPATAPGSYLNIKLEGMGPKLLVSDLSTADQPVLRWRLVVRGNTAVEFGVVPLSMVVSNKAWTGRFLHTAGVIGSEWRCCCEGCAAETAAGGLACRSAVELVYSWCAT
jgi:hypothetical protein